MEACSARTVQHIMLENSCSDTILLPLLTIVGQRSCTVHSFTLTFPLTKGCFVKPDMASAFAPSRTSSESQLVHWRKEEHKKQHPNSFPLGFDTFLAGFSSYVSTSSQYPRCYVGSAIQTDHLSSTSLADFPARGGVLRAFRWNCVPNSTIFVFLCAQLCFPSFTKVVNSRRESDAGVYWCEARNENGIARSRNATLQVAGELLHFPFPILNCFAPFPQACFIFAAKRTSELGHFPIPNKKSY